MTYKVDWALKANYLLTLSLWVHASTRKSSIRLLLAFHLNLAGRFFFFCLFFFFFFEIPFFFRAPWYDTYVYVHRTPQLWLGKMFERSIWAMLNFPAIPEGPAGSLVFHFPYTWVWQRRSLQTVVLARCRRSSSGQIQDCLEHEQGGLGR